MAASHPISPGCWEVSGFECDAKVAFPSEKGFDAKPALQGSHGECCRQTQPSTACEAVLWSFRNGPVCSLSVSVSAAGRGFEGMHDEGIFWVIEATELLVP